MCRSEGEDSDYDELSDNEINKLLIVTQVSHANRLVKHDGYDRTGDWQSRVKISQDLEQEIDLGLQIYEENLWSQQQWVSIISLESALHTYHISTQLGVESVVGSISVGYPFTVITNNFHSISPHFYSRNRG